MTRYGRGFLVDKEFLLSGTRPLKVDGREKTLVRKRFGQAGSRSYRYLKSSKITSSIASPYDQGGSDDRERTAFLDVTCSTKKRLGRVERWNRYHLTGSCPRAVRPRYVLLRVALSNRAGLRRLACARRCGSLFRSPYRRPARGVSAARRRSRR